MQGQQRYPNPNLQPPQPPPQQVPPPQQPLHGQMSNLSLAPNGVTQNGHMQPPMPQPNYQQQQHQQHQHQQPPPPPAQQQQQQHQHQQQQQYQPQQQPMPQQPQQQPMPQQPQPPPRPQQPQPPSFHQPPPATSAPRPAARPMRPAPPSTIPTRPFPNGPPAPQQPGMYNPATAPQQQPPYSQGPAPPGVAPPQPQGQQPPGPPMAGGYPPQQQPPQQQQPQQMTSLVVPRPVYKLCGVARPYFYRSLISSGSSERASLPQGVVTQIPSSNADYVSLDDGNARLRFARLTTNAIHVDPATMNKSQVPFAVLLQPFADLQSREDEVPTVFNFQKELQSGTSSAAKGPLRCGRCNAYVNPGFRFLNGGQEFQCNICHFVNKTPQEHFSPINHLGQRMDADQKPELKFGSVDYIVESPDYYINPPQPSKYVFAIDMSLNSINSGLALSSLQSIKSCIMANLIPGCNMKAGGKSRIAIITFDKAIHFFDARGCDPSDQSRQVKMNIVSDIMDPFVPIGGNALFLTPQEAICAIDTAIDIHKLNVAPGSNNQQQQQQEAQQSAECSLGSVLQIIKESLFEIGGKVYLVSGSIPTSGLHKLERRGGGVINSNEEREMSLLKEANASYDILGCELADNNISVDMILAPTSIYIDASTLSKVCRNSGGKMFLFTGFDIIRDGASLHRTICKNVGEVRAFEALLRVRTSPGIESKGEYIGNFGRPQRGDDLVGPVFDSTSTLGLEFSVVSKLDADDKNNSNGQANQYNNAGDQNRLYNDICIQAAILYTDCNGLRRIRVHTMFLKKTSVMADMFSSADVDATAAFLSKRVASAVLYGNTPFSKGWDGVMQKMSQMFYMYRKHCTSTQASGQLILPEAYKTLPLLMLGFVKSAAMRKNGGADGVTIDERASALSFLISATVPEIAAFCYPRIYNVSDMPESAGIPLPPPPSSSEATIVEPLSLPDAMECAASCLAENTVLLVDAGVQLILWVGAVGADNEELRNLVSSDLVAQQHNHTVIRAENANAAALLKDVSPRGARIAKIVQRICAERKWLSRPVVVQRMQPGTGPEAKWMLPLLVEDRGATQGMPSYMEYLRAVHKQVMEKMANDNAQSDLATWEMLNHGY